MIDIESKIISCREDTNDYRLCLTREEIEEIKTLENENRALKNRCKALTHGTLCFFCPLNCESRDKKFRDDL